VAVIVLFVIDDRVESLVGSQAVLAEVAITASLELTVPPP
jgi:hypothetical protein